LEIEEVRAMLSVIEGVGRGLVDGHGRRLGRGLRRIAVVQGNGIELHGNTSNSRLNRSLFVCVADMPKRERFPKCPAPEDIKVPRAQHGSPLEAAGLHI